MIKYRIFSEMSCNRNDTDADISIIQSRKMFRYNWTGTYLLTILLYLTSYINEYLIKRLKNPHQRTTHQRLLTISVVQQKRKRKTHKITPSHVIIVAYQVCDPYTIYEYVGTYFLNVEFWIYEGETMRG